MPRRRRTEATVGAKAVKRRRTWKVKRTALPTADLIEVGSTHLAWLGPAKKAEDWLPTCGDMFKTEGAIVKLVPPPGTFETHVESMERSFYEGGAVSVKVMPVLEEAKVTIDGQEFAIDGDLADDDRTLRQVALDRAARVKNPHDPDALVALVNWAMDKAEA